MCGISEGHCVTAAANWLTTLVRTCFHVIILRGVLSNQGALLYFKQRAFGVHFFKKNTVRHVSIREFAQIPPINVHLRRVVGITVRDAHAT